MYTRSIECPNCKNDFWSICNDTAKCTNCSYERPYHRRQKRDDYITSSQKRQIETIKRYFDGSRYSRDGQPTKEIKLETKLQNQTGLVYVSVETGKSLYTQEGGYFAIGRRGGLKVLTTYGLNSNDSAKHYAKVLGGKAGW